MIELLKQAANIKTYWGVKRKNIWIFLIINPLLILLINLPFGEIDRFFNKETVASGIIGGADGPTAIFITFHINWYLIVMIVMEIILIIYLILTRSKIK